MDAKNHHVFLKLEPDLIMHNNKIKCIDIGIKSNCDELKLSLLFWRRIEVNKIKLFYIDFIVLLKHVRKLF